MFFQGVMVAAQLVQEVVGAGQIGDVFRPEESGKAYLPELVAAFDFALGLRGWGNAQGDIVERQDGGQLGVNSGRWEKKKLW
jgi:hypothetical protein